MHRVLRALFLLGALGCAKASAPIPGGLVDDGGTRVSLSKPATRVVSLIPATTEMVFALGAGDRLVGRTTWCDYPAETARVPDLGNGIDPNVEAVVAARPDLILLYKSGANHAAAERFRGLGLPTLELATDRMADYDRATRLVGAALGLPQQAESLIVRTARDLAAATKVVTDSARRPSVFILAWDRPAMTLGKGSFLSEILERAGARNVFDDLASSSAPVSIEAVAARNPDFIMVSTDTEPAISKRKEWSVVPAVRERRFLKIRGSEFNRPSPRIGLAVRELTAALSAAIAAAPR